MPTVSPNGDSPETFRSKVDPVMWDEADLRVSVAEHFLGSLRGDPAAGDVDTFQYQHTSYDLQWDSPMFLRLNNRHITQRYPQLAEAVRLVTWTRQEVMMAADEGLPLSDPDTMTRVVRNILPNCLGSVLRIEEIGEPFSWNELVQADQAIRDGDPLPDTPTANAIKLSVNLFMDAYRNGHAGLKKKGFFA